MRFFIIASSILFLFACSPTQNDNTQTTAIEIYKPEYAKGFEIQLNSDSSKTIVLYNLERPGEVLQKIHWRPREISRIACASSTHISMIDRLGRIDDIKGVTVAELVKNKHARQRIDNGEILNITTGEEIDTEIVLSLNPQLLFLYPFGGYNIEKFLKKGIGCVQVSEYLEQHPLGRAEWIKVFGVLLGESEKADSAFNRIKNSYVELKSKVDTAEVQRPEVFYASYSNGSWFAPPGNSFIAQLINDAGATYIFSDSLKTSNLILPFETLFARVYNVDYWGKITYESGDLTLDKIINEDKRLSEIQSVKNKNVFYCNTAETDYHGDALVEPEVILADLISIFHPRLLPQYQQVYFKKIQ